MRVYGLMLPDLDIAAGRVLWCLKKAGPLRAEAIPRFALGITEERIAEVLARLEQRGEVRQNEQNVWSAVG